MWARPTKTDEGETYYIITPLKMTGPQMIRFPGATVDPRQCATQGTAVQWHAVPAHSKLTFDPLPKQAFSPM